MRLGIIFLDTRLATFRPRYTRLFRFNKIRRLRGDCARAPGFFLWFFSTKGCSEVLPGADGFFNELLYANARKIVETGFAKKIVHRVV